MSKHQPHDLVSKSKHQPHYIGSRDSFDEDLLKALGISDNSSYTLAYDEGISWRAYSAAETTCLGKDILSTIERAYVKGKIILLGPVVEEDLIPST